jgi:hypothetical protein
VRLPPVSVFETNLVGVAAPSLFFFKTQSKLGSRSLPNSQRDVKRRGEGERGIVEEVKMKEDGR